MTGRIDQRNVLLAIAVAALIICAATINFMGPPAAKAPRVGQVGNAEGLHPARVPLCVDLHHADALPVVPLQVRLKFAFMLRYGHHKGKQAGVIPASLIYGPLGFGVEVNGQGLDTVQGAVVAPKVGGGGLVLGVRLLLRRGRGVLGRWRGIGIPGVHQGMVGP